MMSSGLYCWMTFWSPPRRSCRCYPCRREVHHGGALGDGVHGDVVVEGAHGLGAEVSALNDVVVHHVAQTLRGVLPVRRFFQSMRAENTAMLDIWPLMTRVSASAAAQVVHICWVTSCSTWSMNRVP